MSTDVPPRPGPPDAGARAGMGLPTPDRRRRQQPRPRKRFLIIGVGLGSGHRTALRASSPASGPRRDRATVAGPRAHRTRVPRRSAAPTSARWARPRSACRPRAPGRRPCSPPSAPGARTAIRSCRHWRRRCAGRSGRAAACSQIEVLGRRQPRQDVGGKPLPPYASASASRSPTTPTTTSPAATSGSPVTPTPSSSTPTSASTGSCAATCSRPPLSAPTSRRCCNPPTARPEPRVSTAVVRRAGRRVAYSHWPTRIGLLAFGYSHWPMHCPTRIGLLAFAYSHLPIPI